MTDVKDPHQLKNRLQKWKSPMIAKLHLHLRLWLGLRPPPLNCRLMVVWEVRTVVRKYQKLRKLDHQL